MATAITVSHRHQTSQPKCPKFQNAESSAINHAVRLIHAVCGLVGSATWIDDIRADLRANKVQAAIRHRDTAVVFDWLMAALSYQGIADAVAYDYMEKHGRAEWRFMWSHAASKKPPVPQARLAFSGPYSSKAAQRSSGRGTLP